MDRTTIRIKKLTTVQNLKNAFEIAPIKKALLTILAKKVVQYGQTYVDNIIREKFYKNQI